MRHYIVKGMRMPWVHGKPKGMLDQLQRAPRKTQVSYIRIHKVYEYVAEIITSSMHIVLQARRYPGHCVVFVDDINPEVLNV